MKIHAPKHQQEALPSSHDILCGSGDLVRSHKGNHLFRWMLRKHFSLYERAMTKPQKMGVTRLVFDEICLTGARFLRKDPIFQDRWYLATDKQGKDKISHCLRKMKREHRRHHIEAPDATSTMASRALPRQSYLQEHGLSQPLSIAKQGIDRYAEEGILKHQMVAHQRDLFAQEPWNDQPTTHVPAKEGSQSSVCEREGASLGFPNLATNRWSTLGVAPPGIDWGFHEAQQGDCLLSTLGENSVSSMQAMSASSHSAVRIWEGLAATFASHTSYFTPTNIESQGASVISL